MKDPAPPSPPDLLAVVGRPTGSDRTRRRIVRVGIVLLLLGLTGWGAKRLLARRAEASRPRFVTEPAALRDLNVTIGATGTLAGLRTVEVGSEVSGKLTELKVDFNDVVQEGDVLAIIDPEQSQATVDEAAANVTSADAGVVEQQATYDESKLSLARADEQLKEGLISQGEYESIQANEKRAKAALTRARASAQLARASLKSAQSRLEKTVIRSPISGIVQARLVENGQTLTAGMETPVLFKITEDLKQMRLSVSIDEADIGRVKEGQKATFTVDAFPGRVFDSEVLSIHNEPETEQNVVTYEGVLAVDNAEQLLRPGMTATATILTEEKKGVLSVSTAAFRYSPPKTGRPGFGPPGPSVAPPKQEGIWILEGGMPRKVVARAGATDGSYAELLTEGAVQPGTVVITDIEEAP